MISRFGYFSFRLHWIQLLGSKNSQREQTTGSAEIWSPTWKGQTSIGRVNDSWVTVQKMFTNKLNMGLPLQAWIKKTSIE